MNRKLKMRIKLAFSAPLPVRKNEFLQKISFPKATYSDFIFSQIRYIRKRVWMMSIALVISVLLGLRFIYIDDIFRFVWIVFSVLPFIVLISVMEISRSTSCHMEELEMSCRYSLTDIVLVRLGILGSLNFTVFVILLLLFSGKTGYSFWRLGIYMLVPFMLTCTLSLFVLNHVRIRETFYICGGISCFVSVLNSVLVYSIKTVFTDKFLTLWGIVFFALLILMIFQTFKYIWKLEGKQWNLQLTV